MTQSSKDYQIQQESFALDEKEVKPVKRFLTPLLTKKVPLVPDDSERKILPVYTKNILSRIFFTWLIPLFNVGYKRTLDFNDLWKLDERLSIRRTYPKFQFHLNEIVTRHRLKTGQKNKIPRIAIIKALLLTFQWEYMMAVFLAMVNYAAQIVAPVLIKDLINVVEMRVLIPSSPINDGVGYAIGITLLVVLSSLAKNHSFQYSKTVGAHSRTIITKALLEKSFKANSKTKHDFPNGKVFTLMSSDLAKIDLGLSYFPSALSFPIPTVVGIALLIVNIGPAALSGIGIFFVTIGLFAFPVYKFESYRRKSAVYTDKRVGLMRELINAMKMIKFHSWEAAYEEQIVKERSKESSYIFKCEILMNMMFGAVFNLSLFSSMTAFLVLYATRSHNGGNIGSIFASLALYSIFTLAIAELPMILGECVAGWVSLTRITQYLESPIEEVPLDEKFSIDEGLAIKISNGEFEWEQLNDEKDQNRFKLKNINLDIRTGEFVVVTGSIGSGKSALLQAITGGMQKLDGNVSINGSSIFYAMPWIQSASIRENITFGSKYNAILYRKVIKACALESDLNLLPAGDLTEVGERGVTLSGGQKARISLARAIYSQRDIYFLDDVLSAVDAKVGRHIVENCFLDLIGDKTKVLATHQLSLIYKADRVVFLNGDGTIDVGTVTELMRSNEKFISLMNHTQTSSKSKGKDIDITKKSDTTEALEEFEGIEDVLYGVEEKAVNAIPFSVYKQYVQAGSGFLSYFALPVVIITTALSVFTSIFSNVWLSFWIDNKFPNLSGGAYIAIYVCLAIASLLSVMSVMVTIGYMSVNASKRLNLNAVKRFLHTPMSFIETTPSGRILNRFTKDTNSLDNEIGNQVKMLTYMAANIIGILVLCVIYLPWFAIAVPIIVLIFFTVTNYYQASSREVKRLEALSRSHVYNNFNEVLNGISTIKSYDAEKRFMEKNDRFVDQLNEAYLVTVSNQRWIGISLNMTGCGIALIVVLLALARKFNLTAASTGLITTYVLNLSDMLSETLVAFSEVENEMNSVERLCYYANGLKQEAAFKISGREPSPEWPQEGVIKFTNVCLRYREGLPLVLKNLNFIIRPNEKIGICGRTGAGKSSMITALYRLVELTDGMIEIDGIDIHGLGLHDLRSKLSIIPQDPVLFEGTVRKNLDPFNEKTDIELFDALRRSGLIRQEDIEATEQEDSSKALNKFHLDSIVEDEGSNFSLGERQLLALARALVRRSKILIMDEATSSVDYETDALVQRTIAREFKECTVLCIAHRLKTILKHDRILVLEKGEVEEFDTPSALYRNGGRFREMCESSGIGRDDIM